LTTVTIAVSENQLPRAVERFQTLIGQELNVKKVVWRKVTQDVPLTVLLDVKLTNELKEEGEARELIRAIQNLRREAGLAASDRAKMQLPDWPDRWQAEIETKTRTQLVKGEGPLLLE